MEREPGDGQQERICKPFPHVHRGPQGLRFLVRAYRSGRRRGALLIAGLCIIATGLALLHMTAALVFAVALLPVSVFAVAWNVRYANKVTRLAANVKKGRTVVGAVRSVRYLPMSKAFGRPMLNSTEENGRLRDPPFDATCVIIDGNFYLIRGDHGLKEHLMPGREIEYDAVPGLAILLRVNGQEVADSMWCHPWHFEGLRQDVLRLTGECRV